MGGLFHSFGYCELFFYFYIQFSKIDDTLAVLYINIDVGTSIRIY